MPKLLKLPPVQNFGANLTAIIPQMILGLTYDAFIGEMSGTTITKALMKVFRGNLNGKMFWNVEGSHLDSQNKYKRMTANADYFSVNFAERTARTINGEQIGSIDTSINIDTLDIEMDWGAVSADAKLVMYAMVSPPKPITINGEINPNKTTISAMLKKTHSLSGAAGHDVIVPVGSRLGGLIKRVHFHHSGNVTAIEVRKDGNYLQQVGKVGLVAFVQDELNRSSQNNHEVWDPMFSDNQSDAIKTLKKVDNRIVPASFEYTITTTADEDTLVSYTELYTNIARL
ncbi:MAG: major capsid protein P2 [Methylococcales bacterium]